MVKIECTLRHHCMLLAIIGILCNRIYIYLCKFSFSILVTGYTNMSYNNPIFVEDDAMTHTRDSFDIDDKSNSKSNQLEKNQVI